MIGTVVIPLKQGLFALIDEEDAELVSGHIWHVRRGYSTAYVQANVPNPRTGRRTVLCLHRLITQAPKGFHVDHINGNGLDNRRSNLRVCTCQQNACNARTRKGTSSFKGVCWHKTTGRWIAYIGGPKTRTWLGDFTDEIEAAKAYDDAARKRYGEFARLNEPAILRAMQEVE